MTDQATKKRFSPAMRESIVRLVVDGGRKCSDVAAEHQVLVSSIYAWVRQARMSSLETSEGGQPSVATLLQDNAKLRKELK